MSSLAQSRHTRPLGIPTIQEESSTKVHGVSFVCWYSCPDKVTTHSRDLVMLDVKKGT